jgi:glycosyltransferase involved in cell wall biosynthesis
MISVVIPAFNEGQGIRSLFERLSACARTWNEDYEFVLVDDGSRDDTLDVAERIAETDRHVKVVSLSRNFGHQAAVTAGLDHACGDLVAIIDADLQDPPEELPRFFHKCREGFDIVYGVRTKRKEGWVKRMAYHGFYRLLARVASIRIPLDSGDFCVMSRRAVDALASLPERNRFIRGLRSWIGLAQTGVEYERHARAAGEPKYTFSKLLNLALDGIVNFSSRPLRLISVFGMFLAALVLGAAVFVFIQYVADWTVLGYNPRHAQGWTSIILAVMFLASVQLISLGIIGEYLGRLFEEMKQRPVYMVGRTVNVERTHDARRAA